MTDPRAVVLLRGINVGGHRKVPMPAQRAALVEAGFEDPRTHLQSGNIVLAAAPGTALAGRIKDLVRATFGFEVQVLTRSREDLARTLAGNPFVDEAQAEPARVHVFFLDGEPERGRALDQERSPDDRFVLVGRELYVHHRHGAGQAKLNLSHVERTLGVLATARNWNTVVALAELVGAQPA